MKIKIKKVDIMKIKYNTIIVENLEESVKFYTETMGFKIYSEHPLPQAMIIILKGEGDTMIELIKNETNEVGFYSIGMDVENLDMTVKKLKSQGVEFILEPTEITVGFMASFRDPNGTNIVLIQHN